MHPTEKAVYIYGPVLSRRLGFSLGIDLVTHKICSFDCIYCQLGKTTDLTLERKVYLPPEIIIQQVKDAVANNKRIDYLTFSGSGEPTLNSKIGYIIAEIKKFTDIPVAVLTNGSLLFRIDVQDDLLNADLVLPTLCAVTEETMQKINCFHKDLTAKKIIQGLIDFNKKYHGKIWLEFMLIKGINDTPAELEKMKRAIAQIKPDKVQLNTVVRPPSEKSAIPLSIEELTKIKDYLGAGCEIIAEFAASGSTTSMIDKQGLILDMIKRRPVTLDDISNSLGLQRQETLNYVDRLKQEAKILSMKHKGKTYYRAITDK